MNAPIWFSNLAFWSIQSAALVLCAAFLARLLQIRNPRALLIHWRVLLGVVLLLPFIQPWHRPHVVAAMSSSRDVVPPFIPPSSIVAPAGWHFLSLDDVSRILAIVILVGIVFRFAVFFVGLYKLARLRRSSLPFPVGAQSSAILDQITGLVRVRSEFRLSPRLDSPVTFGVASPAVLLPERFLHLEPHFQSAIACHELIHIRRHDWMHHLVEEFLRIIFWFHPVILWLITRTRLAREQVVDLEVVNLTQARKPYLQALLEFAAGRRRIVAIPAPPFLIEREFAERVALMLKEDRMSRNKLIASFATIALTSALAAVLLTWAFPLKAAPKLAQDSPGQPTSEGFGRNVLNGSAQPSQAASADEPTVNGAILWRDTVVRGPMTVQVRGLGTLIHADGSSNLSARIQLPELLAKDVKPGQNAYVELKLGGRDFKAHVTSISSEVLEGNRSVEITLDSALPQGTEANTQIEGMIDVARLDNVLSVGRPRLGNANSQGTIFKVIDHGAAAERVNVSYGRVSWNRIEIVSGLMEGDTVILSDMSQWDNAGRIRIKPPFPIAATK
jgi:beta-lactamase regulating signal transducer with metallopeptidase domain